MNNLPSKTFSKDSFVLKQKNETEKIFSVHFFVDVKRKKSVSRLDAFKTIKSPFSMFCAQDFRDSRTRTIMKSISRGMSRGPATRVLGASSRQGRADRGTEPRPSLSAAVFCR